MSEDFIPNVQDLDQYLFEQQSQGHVLDNVMIHEQFFDSMDTKVAFTPSPINISNEEYPGPHQFEVTIHPVPSKQPWVYSAKLTKIYMDMSVPFPIDFGIREPPNGRPYPLFVRATPRYSSTNNLLDPVQRCINHEHSLETSNKGLTDAQHRQHIIRCKNPATQYSGDLTKGDERLSLLTPLELPPPGAETSREMYEFVCKNSCPMPGMNRRPLEVIFTLENLEGQILGRRVLNVRICSCPKRDKEKEEELYSSSGAPPPRGKKRKLPSGKTDKKIIVQHSGQNGGGGGGGGGDRERDMQRFNVNLDLVGKHNVKKVIEYCQDLMASEAHRHAPLGLDGPYNRCLEKQPTVFKVEQ